MCVCCDVWLVVVFAHGDVCTRSLRTHARSHSHNSGTVYLPHAQCLFFLTCYGTFSFAPCSILPGAQDNSPSIMALPEAVPSGEKIKQDFGRDPFPSSSTACISERRHCFLEEHTNEDGPKAHFLSGQEQFAQLTVVKTEALSTAIDDEQVYEQPLAEPWSGGEEEEEDGYEVVLQVNESGEAIPSAVGAVPGQLSPFACVHCGKSFNTKAYLKTHIQAIHLGLKPFICSDCGKAFARSSLLSEHKRLHQDSLAFECTECNRRFRWKSSLQLHMQTHNDRRPFVCTECGESFRWRISLRRHMTKHSSSLAHECKICGKTFRDAYGANQHMRVHSSERPFSCPACLRSFRWKHQVSSHACSRSHIPDIEGDESSDSQNCLAGTASTHGQATPSMDNTGFSHAASRAASAALAEATNQARMAGGGFHFSGGRGSGSTAPSASRVLPVNVNSLTGGLPSSLVTVSRSSHTASDLVVSIPRPSAYNQNAMFLTKVSKTACHLSTAPSSLSQSCQSTQKSSTPSSKSFPATMPAVKMEGLLGSCNGNSALEGVVILPSCSRPQDGQVQAQNSCAMSQDSRCQGNGLGTEPACLHRRRSSTEVDHSYCKWPILGTEMLPRSVRVTQSLSNPTPSCELTRLRRSQLDVAGPPVVTILSDGSVRGGSAEKRCVSPSASRQLDAPSTKLRWAQADHAGITCSKEESFSSSAVVVKQELADRSSATDILRPERHKLVVPFCSPSSLSSHSTFIPSHAPSAADPSHIPTRFVSSVPLPTVQLGKPLVF